jgi:low affinity Fe/Cu permease
MTVDAPRTWTMSRSVSRIAERISQWTGRPFTFIFAALVVAIWAVSGPVFHFSDTWLLVMNTGTSVVTFLMVFLIQNEQNRDGAAVQAKLDELIRALEPAKNKFMGIEKLSVEEVQELRAETVEEVKILDEMVAEQKP